MVPMPASDSRRRSPRPKTPAVPPEKGPAGEVVSLDSFRKK